MMAMMAKRKFDGFLSDAKEALGIEEEKKSLFGGDKNKSKKKGVSSIARLPGGKVIQ